MTIILGIDPGTRVTGYGIISEMSLVDFGCIRPPPSLPLNDRYLLIYEAVDHLISKHQPHAVSIETQFVYKNAQSALKLGMARGVVIVAAGRRQIPVYEYAPTKAKIAITGSGKASKMQVQKMVQLLFKLPSLPEPEDAADALALALCHLNSIKKVSHV